MKCTCCEREQDVAYQSYHFDHAGRHINLCLCYGCCLTAITMAVGHLQGSDFDHFLSKFGKEVRKK